MSFIVYFNKDKALHKQKECLVYTGKGNDIHCQLQESDSFT